MFTETFSFANIPDLEKSIADWLKKNLNNEVINVSQSVIKSINNQTFHSVTLEYIQKDKAGFAR